MVKKDDLNQGIKVLKSGMITMGKKTSFFEKIFAKKLKVKYALMTNSGSSANLLAAFASCNPLRKIKFKPGDNAIIQTLCWPTSLWPLVQTGLKINFVDVNPETLNVNADEVLKKVNKKTKVIISIFAGRAGDTGKDPIPQLIKSIKIAKKLDKIEETGGVFTVQGVRFMSIPDETAGNKAKELKAVMFRSPMCTSQFSSF